MYFSKDGGVLQSYKGQFHRVVPGLTAGIHDTDSVYHLPKGMKHFTKLVKTTLVNDKYVTYDHGEIARKVMANMIEVMYEASDDDRLRPIDMQWRAVGVGAAILINPSPTKFEDGITTIYPELYRALFESLWADGIFIKLRKFESEWATQLKYHYAS